MIHQFKQNGYDIVLDVNSGSVHVVDDIAYDAIALYNDKIIEHHISEEEALPSIKSEIRSRYSDVSDDDFDELIGEIKELRNDGQLFTEDIYEKFVRDFKNRITVTKALCLNVAHDCNLACRYCFAGQGEYQGDRALMSYETGKAALDFLIEHSG
ncbi:MAG: thioether cross-link-forming SCIFF peptide maturase, partial [Catonella sp.]|nr:thioether cross-link-forming SCIFF peptide maturase [Catonella sp.]